MSIESPPRTTRYMRLGDVAPATRNPRTHATELVTNSIRRFGFVDGAVHDGRTGRIIAGHGRLEGLTVMRDAGEAAPDGILVDPDGEWVMPVQVGWASRSDADAEALLIVLNKATEAATWQKDELDQMLADLQAGDDPDLLDLTGFTLDGIDDGADPSFDPEDDGTRLDQREPVECPSCAYRWRVGPRGQVEPC